MVKRYHNADFAKKVMGGNSGFCDATSGGDAALLVTLPSGSYTVTARAADGTSGASGEVLLEVYVAE